MSPRGTAEDLSAGRRADEAAAVEDRGGSEGGEPDRHESNTEAQGHNPARASIGWTQRASRRVAQDLRSRPWHENRRAVAALAVLLVVLPTMIAFIVSSSRADLYEARAEVLFSVEDAFVDEATSETLALIGRSDLVLAPVAEAAGLTMEDLESSVTTSVVDTTTVVAVEVKRTDPDEATSLAGSIADQWVDTARRAPTPRTTAVSALIGSRTERLGEVEALLTSPLASPEDRATLEQERDGLLASLEDLEVELAELQGQDAFLGHQADVLAPAKITNDGSPVEPKPLLAAVAGGVIGLVLAGALVALAWQLNVRE